MKLNSKKVSLIAIIVIMMGIGGGIALSQDLGFNWIEQRINPTEVNRFTSITVESEGEYISADVEVTGDLYVGNEQTLVSLSLTNENSHSISSLHVKLYVTDGVTEDVITERQLDVFENWGSINFTPAQTITMLNPSGVHLAWTPILEGTLELRVEITNIVVV